MLNHILKLVGAKILIGSFCGEWSLLGGPWKKQPQKFAELRQRGLPLPLQRTSLIFSEALITYNKSRFVVSWRGHC